jgi:hypothetical protein
LTNLISSKMCEQALGRQTFMRGRHSDTPNEREKERERERKNYEDDENYGLFDLNLNVKLI